MNKTAWLVLALAMSSAAAAAEEDPWVPRPLDGPYPAIAEYCKKRIAAEYSPTPKPNQAAIAKDPESGEWYREDREQWHCDCPHPDADLVGKLQADKLSGGWLAAQVFTNACRSTDESIPDMTFAAVLALKTERGWYFAMSPARVQQKHNNDYFVNLRLTQRAGGTELLWSFIINHNDRQSETDETNLIVIGLGPSQVPSATSRISRGTIGGRKNPDGSASYSRDEQPLRVTWDKAGRLKLPGKGAVPHKLVFP